MKENIVKTFQIIMDDPNLSERMSVLTTVDELYEFCTSISGGYTFEEFYEFVREELEWCQNVTENELQKVSGGTGKSTKLNHKVVASLLAVMSASSPFVGAAADGSSSPSVMERAKTKAKSVVSKVKDFVSKHKMPIAGGVSGAALGTAILLLFKSHHGKDNKQHGDRSQLNRVDATVNNMPNHDTSGSAHHDDPPTPTQSEDYGCFNGISNYDKVRPLLQSFEKLDEKRGLTNPRAIANIFIRIWQRAGVDHPIDACRDASLLQRNCQALFNSGNKAGYNNSEMSTLLKRLLLEVYQSDTTFYNQVQLCEKAEFNDRKAFMDNTLSANKLMTIDTNDPANTRFDLFSVRLFMNDKWKEANEGKVVVRHSDQSALIRAIQYDYFVKYGLGK